MKKCTKCGEIKPLDSYYKRAENRDGHHKICKQCWTLKNKEWYQANKKHKLESASEYRESNRQPAREYAKNYRAQNPDKVKKQNSEWRANNRQKVRDLGNKRRARKIANGEYDILPKFYKKLYASPCVNCGSTKNITQDHIIPIARGGRHSEGNLQPLCKKCNSSKKDKLMFEWLLYLR